MLNFIELALSHLSSVSRSHCRAFLPAADQHSCSTWNSNTCLSLWAAEGQWSPGTVPMQLKHGSLCTHLHNYNSDTFKLYFEFSQEQKFVFLAKVPASKWQGAYIPSTSMLSCLSWDITIWLLALLFSFTGSKNLSILTRAFTRLFSFAGQISAESQMEDLHLDLFFNMPTPLCVT